MEDSWKATDDSCTELIVKALDEMSYQHHPQILDWFAEIRRLARVGRAVEETVLDAREAQHGELLREMHIAMRQKLVPSVDMTLDAVSSLVDLVVYHVISNQRG